MLDQAYDQGCEVALQELAEAFGEDVVEELVKIAAKGDMSNREMAGMAAGGLAGGAGLGAAGRHFGGTAKGQKKWMDEALNKYRRGFFDTKGVLKDKNLSKEDLLNKAKSRSKWLKRGAKGLRKNPLGIAGGLAGAAGLGYAGKRLAE